MRRSLHVHDELPRGAWLYIGGLAGALAWLALGVAVRDLGGFSATAATGLASPQFFWIGLPMALVALWLAVTFLLAVVALAATFGPAPRAATAPGRRRAS